MTLSSTAASGKEGGMNVLKFLSRYGVIAAMVLTVVVFSLLRPDSFFTVFMLKSILRDSAPLMMLALGLTFVMVMNDFDMSVGGLTALLATIAVMLVSTAYAGIPVWVAIPVTLIIGAAIGAMNGALIAYLKLHSFILTIAMGTVFTGLALQLTGSASIYSGIPTEYTAISGVGPLGLSNQIYIGILVLFVSHVVLRHTQPGRYMYALGGNPEATRMSGVPVRVLKMSGYAIVGLMAAITGIMLTSQAGAANPNTGLGLLMPAYAAAFLGSSMLRVGQFSAVGTALGALFLQIIGSGLTVLNLSGSLIQLIQGGILVLAVVLARFNNKAA